MEPRMSVAATLSLESSATQFWDAVVVGAGPAGAMAARELARRGISVLLVDRAQFPRYKVCGGCLNPRSLRLLSQAGLAELTEKLGAIPLNSLKLGARGRFANVRVPTGAGISREAFDVSIILAAIAAGASFLPGTTASLLPVASTDRRVLHLRRGGASGEVVSRVVLGATGLGGRLDPGSSQTGVEASIQAWRFGSRVGAGVMVPTVPDGYSPHVIYMACAREGYVGQVIVEGNRMDVAAALDPLAVKAAGGTGELAVAIMAEAGFPPVPGLSSLPWKGTPYLTRRALRLGDERLFLLGDAAGYLEPFTGEGMAWALAGASVVAPLAIETIQNGWNRGLLTRWRSAYHRSVAGRQLVCRLTAGVLRRPLATQVMVRGLSVLPWITRPFLKSMYRE
jgi:menaquinone-9 beta-reductase